MRPFALVLLAACGSAPINLDYTNSGIVSVTAGTPITPLVPRVDNHVSAYSVQPAMPPGLVFNTRTGVLSGTPTQPQIDTRYEVVATNSAGLISTTLSITVLAVLPVTFTYATPTLVVAAGAAIAHDVPSLQVSGANFTIAPALPLGLSLNATTGVVSGTPAASQAETAYTVTATLAGNATTAPLAITVQ
jgi:hypothetical protein